MIKTLKKIVKMGRDTGRVLREDQLAAFSAQSAFFMLLSSFPFVMLLLATIKYLPMTQDQFMQVVLDIVPESLTKQFSYMTQEIYELHFGWAAIISGLLAIWSASKGTMAIERGLNFMDHTADTKNYFVRRGINAIYTFIFCVMLILVIGVYILGNTLIEQILLHTNLIEYTENILFVARLLTGPVVVFGVLLLIYYRLPDDKHAFISCIPGAVVAAIGWIGLAIGFSVYVEKIGVSTYMYGSLTGIVLAMLWLYICMYILFLGAEINKFLRKGFWTQIKEIFKKE